MDLEQFLNRIVAPGNFLALAYKFPDWGMTHRFFLRNDTGGAAWYARHISSKGGDVWYALASYKDAELVEKNNHKYYKGQRTQANVDALRCFWFDADVKRPGDGKDPSKVFADIKEVIGWVGGLRSSINLPLPNLWVCSGYGVHLYWTIEQAIDRPTWQPYAEMLKATLAANGAKGDLSVVADAARILRPIGTFNYKDPGNPAQCYLIDENRLCDPDYLNADLFTALTAIAPAPTVGSNSGHAPASGHGGLNGPPPRQGPTPIANAAILPPTTRLRDMALIEAECGQVRQSVREHGANDGRQLWHALVTLAWFCDKGRAWAHLLSDGHAAYTLAIVDAEFDQVERDHNRKGFGPPKCTTLAGERKGICDHCRHAGRITSPYQLVPDELPENYKRVNNHIIHKINDQWHKMIDADFVEPLLEQLPEGNWRLRMRHIYHSAGSPVSVPMAFEDTELTADTARLKVTFNRRGLTTNIDNTRPVGKMLMAWIEKLRNLGSWRKSLPCFGWAKDNNNKIIGFAVGGQCYMSNGEVEKTFGADELMLTYYKPKGDMAHWRRAIDYVIKDQPVLQVAVAVAFGAPLIELTGESGMCINIWSAQSATGKSTAFKLGASVWGKPLKTIHNLGDTMNSVMLQVGQTSPLPAYWDEVVHEPDWLNKFKNMMFKMTLGRDKTRMTADIRLRGTDDCHTIMMVATNKSIRDYINDDDNSTDATAVRLLDIEHKGSLVWDASVAPVISALNENHSWAGIEYARYLSTHADEVCQLVKRAQDAIMKGLVTSAPAERFYVAGASAILAGAALSKKLGIINFDLHGITKVLCDAILASRTEATEYGTSVANEAEWVAEHLNRFCNDHIGECVVTQYLKPSGPGQIASNTIERGYQIAVPQQTIRKRSTPAFQISLREQLLRVDQEALRDWCNSDTGRNSTQRRLLKLAKSQLGGVNGQGAIGAGTDYRGGKVRYIDISLTVPELAHWLGMFAAPATVVPLRPNQPAQAPAPAAAPPAAGGVAAASVPASSPPSSVSPSP